MSLDDGPMEGAPEFVPEPKLVEATSALFEQAVRENTRRLLAIAHAIAGRVASPEDVVQQALLDLYVHRARYEWRQPEALMRRAVVNQSLRVLRQPRTSQVTDDLPARGDSPIGAMMGREAVEKMREAIDALPEHFRAALVLCEYEKMPYAQIADVLDASVPQIRNWLHRARRHLEHSLQDFAKADARD